MSFDLSVDAREWPEDLHVAWERAMEEAGLPARMQLQVGERVEAWGGFLPWTLADGRLAGCEVIVSTFPSSREWDVAPDVVASVLFSTSMGRSDDDLRVQWFGAATLALVTSGTLCDLQEGVTYEGKAAIQEAQKQCGPGGVLVSANRRKE